MSTTFCGYNDHSVFDGCVAEVFQIFPKRFVPLILIRTCLLTDSGAVSFVDCYISCSSGDRCDCFDMVGDLLYGVQVVDHVEYV